MGGCLSNSVFTMPYFSHFIFIFSDWPWLYLGFPWLLNHFMMHILRSNYRVNVNVCLLFVNSPPPNYRLLLCIYISLLDFTSTLLKYVWAFQCCQWWLKSLHSFTMMNIFQFLKKFSPVESFLIIILDELCSLLVTLQDRIALAIIRRSHCILQIALILQQSAFLTLILTWLFIKWYIYSVFTNIFCIVIFHIFYFK